MDKNKGWKLSLFVENARELNYDNDTEVEEAIKMMKKLHDANISSNYDFDIWEKTINFIEKLKIVGKCEFEGFDNLFNKMNKLHDLLMNDSYSKKCLCHCDCYSPNFLFNDNNELFLIDWEYSGNDDPASDVGTFICCSNYNYDKTVKIIKLYLNRTCDTSELNHYLGYIAIASYYWYIWALYQDTRGNPVGEWEYLWYKNANYYSDLILK